MNGRDIPRYKKWTPDQPSSVPLKPWTPSEPYKKFVQELCVKIDKMYNIGRES